MTVLIVDDNTEIREILRIRLKSEGYQVIEASSASKAFELLSMDSEASHKHPIDLILMDIMMPDISGIEACRRMKQNPDTRDIPVIIVTASGNVNHLEEAFEAGAMDYLSKPFKKIELMARIRSAIRLMREIKSRKRHEAELSHTLKKLREVNRQLERLSSMDGLTGLYNRRYFDQNLKKEFFRAVRNGRVISLIMIDIDEFKAFNDLYGHQAGDQCLKLIADTFFKVVGRSNDLVARYGGEEFCVILPDTSEQGAGAVAETLRNEVMKLDLNHAHSKWSQVVTISVGVASIMPTRDSRIDKLIHSADKALYESKENGRNRVTIAKTKGRNQS